MHYNILNYGNDYGDCTAASNNVITKNLHLQALVNYLEPDILTVNEISEDPYFHDLLLESVFNVNGTDQYKRGYPPNLGNAPIINGIFYNSERVALLSNEAVETNYRDIDIFQFSYPGPGNPDSIIMHVAVAHLKAGSDQQDEQERAIEAAKLMSHLNSNDITGNVLLCGDLNLYGSSEAAFQKLVLDPNEDIRLHDPINQVGEWHANSYFSPVHTQSTHIIGGCPAGGGMDDRFDFILVSGEVIEGSLGIKCIPSSYRAIGQDGLRFDQSLVSPPNNSVPGEILSALYAVSDHLPLILDLIVAEQPGSVPGNRDAIAISFRNPASGALLLNFPSFSMTRAQIDLTDLFGRTVWSGSGILGHSESVSIPVSDLADGLYLLRVNISGSTPIVARVIISNR